MRTFFVIAFLYLSGLVVAQAPTFDEMEFEMDSTKAAYKPAGKYFALVKSKRGNSGVAKTSKADSILAFPITEIVLVYSELNAEATAERDQANRERWENLLKTYPDLFQFSTTYKNVCQCNYKGDSAAFKKMQGFYVYFTPEEPKKSEVKPAVAVKEEKKEEVKVVKEEKKEEKSTSRKDKEDEKLAAKEKENEKRKEREREKEAEKAEKEAAKAKKEKEKEEKELAKSKDKDKEKEKEKEKEDDTPLQEGPETTVTISDADLAKATVKKRAGYTKPKRTKDPKACRPACYGNGDEDLNAFFVSNIPLTKKQKRHGKQLNAQLKLQLNIDGSIKKAFITGTNEDLNKLVMESVKSMDLWNPTIRNGVTVKSEIKLTLKYDKESKGMKVFESALIPRLLPKCKCASDEELGLQ